MKNIYRLLMKAKKAKKMIMMFLPFVVPDQITAEKVSSNLDEFCEDRPYNAIIIYGENELSDGAEGVIIDHIGGAANGKTQLET